MLTGEIRSQIDSIWNDFWAGGVANPLSVMEQMTYLLFIKRLDDLHTLEERKSQTLKIPMERRIFPEGRDDKGRPYLREAVRNAALRPRCAAYLAEIATTPRHLLERMGLRTGRAGIPLFLDETYLGTIFGNGAPEVLQIINAGLRPRADLMGRTQAEADPDRRVDHLFAPAPRANEAEAADAGSTAGTTHPDAVATRLVESSPRSQGDRLFPRTMIELPQSDDATERVEHPIEVDEEDWDIGLAELDGPPASGDRTAQMPIQDDEEDERR